MPRAQTNGETQGFLKAVVDAATDRILGTAFFVAEASELNAVIHLYIVGILTLEEDASAAELPCGLR